MVKQITKTIGIIMILAGVIILLSSLGVLSIKFFAVGETTASYDGRYIRIPFAASGSYSDMIEITIKPSVLPENICGNVGTYNEGVCSVTCDKIALKNYV